MKKNPKLFTFILLLLVLALGGVSAYLYIQWNDTKGKQNTLTEEFNGLENIYKEVSNQLKNNQEAQDAEKLAAKYDTFTLLGKCGVGLSYPDESNRYDPFSAAGIIDGRNRAWRLSTEEIKKSFDADKDIMIGGTRYQLLLRNDNEASGYISSAIFVECRENTEGYSNDTFAKAYFNIVNKNNKASITDLGGSLDELKNYDVKVVEAKKMWGIDVNKTLVEKFAISSDYPENGYMFVHKNKIYYIYTIGAATEKQVTRATNNIINSIYLY